MVLELSSPVRSAAKTGSVLAGTSWPSRERVTYRETARE